MAADPECCYLIFDFLQRHGFSATLGSFVLECPHLDLEREPRVEARLEAVVERHRSHRTFRRDWEEVGQGQMLNQLCTRLQSDLEQIKDFTISALQVNEKPLFLKGRSRSMRRSQDVNLVRPLTLSTVHVQHLKTPAVAPPPTQPAAAPPSAQSRSPYKRKGMSPQKRPAQALSSVLPAARRPRLTAALPPSPLPTLAPDACHQNLFSAQSSTVGSDLSGWHHDNGGGSSASQQLSSNQLLELSELLLRGSSLQGELRNPHLSLSTDPAPSVAHCTGSTSSDGSPSTPVAGSSQPGSSTAHQPGSDRGALLQPQPVDVEQVLKEILANHHLPQVIADSINSCQGSEPDSFLQSVLDQVTCTEPFLGQLMEPGPTEPQQLDGPPNLDEGRTLSSQPAAVQQPSSSQDPPTPSMPKGFNPELSIDVFLDQLHNNRQ